MTGKRLEILEYIEDRIGKEGLAPTIREIGKAVGLASTSNVLHHLQQLENDGLIKRHRRVSRGIVLQ